MKKCIPALLAAAAALTMMNPMKAYAEYYTTSEYNVDVVVNEDHSYDIVETINVTFTEPRHGIYRYIPTSGSYYREIDGEAVESNYYATITDVSVEGYNYSVYRENNNKVIQIGSEDFTVEGDQTYEISYTYDPGADDIDEFDDFYFNVIPHDWATGIDYAAFTITMPKEFDEDELYVYAGEYGSSSSENVEYYVVDNTIYGYAFLDAYEGVTVNLRLDEGYYEGARNNRFFLDPAVYASVVLLIVGIVFAILYTKKKKIIEVIQFYPPYDFTPAQVGCVYHNGETLPEDALAVLFYLGDKGYLSIEETKKGEYTFHKEKEIDDKIPEHIRPVYEGLFENRDEVTIDELKGHFHKSIKACQNQTGDYFKVAESRLNDTKNGKKSFLMMPLAFIPAVIFTIAGYFIGANIAVAFVLLSAIVIFVAALVISNRLTMLENHKTSNNIKTILVCIAILAADLFILVRFNSALSTAGNIIMFVQMFVCAFVIPQMGGTSDYGAEILGQVRGFKRFIETAEKEKLNALVEEKPSYFFDILPYAYVFGITDKWAKNFEGLLIKQPDWCRSYDTKKDYDYFYYDHMMRQTMKDMYRVSVTNNRSGRGGSSGGGGGGGYSGGGAGGGGGGSW